MSKYYIKKEFYQFKREPEETIADALFFLAILKNFLNKKSDYYAFVYYELEGLLDLYKRSFIIEEQFYENPDWVDLDCPFKDSKEAPDMVLNEIESLLGKYKEKITDKFGLSDFI